MPLYVVQSSVDFDDNLCLLAESYCDIETKINDLCVEASNVGLRVNAKKTEELWIDARNNFRY